MESIGIRELDSAEIDAVAGGPLWFAALALGFKAGLAGSAGAGAAAAIGASIGVAAATAALAAEIIE